MTFFLERTQVDAFGHKDRHVKKRAESLNLLDNKQVPIYKNDFCEAALLRDEN